MFIALPDLNVHYRERGAAGAPALILLHSLGTSSVIWDQVAERLAQVYRVIQPDMRGHGLTDVTQGPYTIAGLAEDVLALMDRLGIGKAHIAGISIGGLIAQQIGHVASGRVDTLTLLDTAPVFPDSRSWRERAALVRVEGVAVIADTVLDRWITPQEQGTPNGKGLRQIFLRTASEGYAGACEALASCDLSAGLKHLAIRSLVIVGENDEATPPEVSRRMVAEMPEASLVKLEGLRHIPVMEAGTRISTLMNCFLAGEQSNEPAADLYETGLKVRSAVLGGEHVSRSLARITRFDEPFQHFITRTAWGQVWSRPHFDRRTRSIVTLALLAGLGCEEEFELHIKASRNTGCTDEDIAELLLHVALYAGIPRANSAMHRAKRLLSDPDEQQNR
ncbi:bifunctional 3-oxoadipate enol-lactonase/4-carboxymuconolactone decarboxylase PcaDC [Asaia prunellae]|uniref:bifunctional 3-oxoadipate enol-lactonase/4-carboxymuconolactone decarboxylase PcaDC n=1 Tax=Asaia prunellae TaxID=610245 RepID=UPI0004719F8F|nr:4-carboxymuconolactone decarboxylase [Asaia prunellae]